MISNDFTMIVQVTTRGTKLLQPIQFLQRQLQNQPTNCSGSTKGSLAQC